MELPYHCLGVQLDNHIHPLLHTYILLTYPSTQFLPVHKCMVSSDRYQNYYSYLLLPYPSTHLHSNPLQALEV